ncbi:MAG TPA: TetR/AcrR family transcriptional regulator [Solirubrobacteraceae bacterium]|nr:TetR/AcrR family transcriptional regulator [Solirubrobacteraceae bacterium]
MQVSDVQRRRLLAAIAEAADERGLALVTVADIVAKAGVSRRTFYELFEDRTDCFLAALEDALERATPDALEAYAGQERWEARMRAGLTVILRFLDEERQLGVLCVVHALGGDPAVLARRAQVLRALERAVDEGRAGGARGAGLPPLVAEGVVGGVFSVVHARLLDADSAPLSPLLGSLMSMVVLPYRGPAAAARELARGGPAAAALPAARAADPLRDLGMRLTYRTLRALSLIVEQPGASNREVARGAGIADQGQASKLLTRLERLGLIENIGGGSVKGSPNAWTLTPRGRQVGAECRVKSE